MTKINITIQSGRPKKIVPVSERNLCRAAIRDKIACQLEAKAVADDYDMPCTPSEFGG